jgi:hypothetical protein
MARFQIDVREVVVHAFTVEAASKDEAIDKIYDENLVPDFTTPICYEVDDVQEMKTDKDYYDARGKNRDFLEGNEKIVLDEMVES